MAKTEELKDVMLSSYFSKQTKNFFFLTVDQDTSNIQLVYCHKFLSCDFIIVIGLR